MNAWCEPILAKIAEIARLHDEAFRHYAKSGAGWKSSEGYIEIRLGNFWEREENGLWGDVGIGVYSYALGPSRMHDFDSVDDALREVSKWHAEEMQRGDDD